MKKEGKRNLKEGERRKKQWAERRGGNNVEAN